jgi:valyl-tRNA synthetase
LAKERERLQREVGKAEGEIAKIQKKLGNEQFLAKAPEAVIEEQKDRQGEAVQTRDKLAAALERLAGA